MAISKINDLSNYMASRGLERKYKDHYRTIMAWIRRDNPTPVQETRRKL